MKTVILTTLLLFVAAVTISSAGEYVRGYTKKNGTYVQGYNRTSADSTTYNNYSTKGNSNPYTGKKGTKSNSYGYSTSKSKRSSYGY